jgi:type I restriction enzyme, S subunit
MKAGWQIKTLGEILQKTETTNPIQAPEDEFEYIDVSSVSNVTFQIEDTQHLLGKDAPSRARKLVRTNDVLFATIRPTLRRIAVVPEYLDKQVCSTGYFVLRPKLGIDHRFMFYWLFSEGFMGQMEILQKGASYPAVTDAEVRAQSIPFPPLPEQQRIVTILDEAFDGIATAKANAEKNLQNARALFESHLQSVFTQRGEGWVEVDLGEVCQNLHQGLNTAGEKVKFYETGYPIIQTRNIDDGVVDLDNKIKMMCEEDWLRYKDKYRPKVGDVFFTNIGTIGKTAIVKVARDYLIHWNIFKLRPYQEKMTSAYLRYTLEHLTLSGYFKKLQKGGTVDFVTKKMISEALIYLPSTLEQIELVGKLDSLREETQQIESIYQQKLAALDALKKTLLDQAFTGQLATNCHQLEKPVGDSLSPTEKE